MSGLSRGRKRLLVLNQYYDSVEATGQVLRQLCEDLAEDFDVTVVAARPPDVAGAREGKPVAGLTVRWIRSARFSKSSLALRGLNYLTFLGGSLVTVSRIGRADVVFCMTDPPLVGLIGLIAARVRKIPLVLGYQDVHPDVGVISGHLTNPATVTSLRLIQRLLLTRADRIVAISRAMKERLSERGARPDRVTVIPNWAELSVVQPQERTNAWARNHGLTDQFTVMHSGNVGYMQSLDTFVDTAVLLPSMRFVIVGEGVNKSRLMRRVRAEGIKNLRFISHQPRTLLGQTLGSADVHVVSLSGGLGGFLEPSKIYGVLAAARPVVAAADPNTETALIVKEAGCGFVVAPDDPDALAAGLCRIAALSHAERCEMGRAGRALVERRHSRSVATTAYRELFNAMIGA
jgi:colanic acid biosynthesis glycosyl transferase WcaI